MSKQTLLYGKHCCMSAISNPSRVCHKLFITKESNISDIAKKKRIPIQIVSTSQIDQLLKNTNHQGVALSIDNPIDKCIYDLVETSTQTDTILLLDGVTDIGNIGSILRTMACFNVTSLVLPKHGAPTNYAELSKTSSGAIELLNIAYVTNLAQSLQFFKKNGYWIYCMDCKGDSYLHDTKFTDKKVLILGGEHSGAKQSTKLESDFLVKIKISDKFDSLNVANTASILLYEISKS